MELLTKKVVKQKQDSQAIELSRTIGILKKEESSIIRRVNDLKQVEIEEREKVQVSLVEIKKESDKAKGEIKSEITNLELEVVGLEERKKEALKPINDIKEEADARLKKAEEKEDYVERCYLVFNEFEEKLAERVETIEKTEKDNLEKTREANERVEAVEERERVIKENEVNFDKEAKEHYILSTELEAVLKIKERELKVKEVVIKELDKRAKEEFSKVAEGRLRLQSDYEALEQASRHLKVTT